MKKMLSQKIIFLIAFLLFGLSMFFLGRLSLYWDGQQEQSIIQGVEFASPLEVEQFVQELKAYDPKTDVEENEIDLYTETQ